MRKVGIASDGQNLDDKMKKHFSKGNYVSIVEWDDVNSRINGSYSISGVQPGDCKCNLLQNLVNEGIESVVTQYMGIYLHDHVNQKGIGVYESSGGTVEDVAVDYFNNSLSLIAKLITPKVKGQGGCSNGQSSTCDHEKSGCDSCSSGQGCGNTQSSCESEKYLSQNLPEYKENGKKDLGK